MLQDLEDCKCLTESAVATTKGCPENPQKAMRKLVRLMKNPMSEEQFLRQTVLLNDLVEATTYAFCVSDLPYVIQLFEMLFDRVRYYCFFKKPLKKLLSFCSMPPLLMKSSDNVTYARDLEEYFSFLGYALIYARDVDIRDLVLNALIEVLDRRVFAAVNCVTNKTVRESVENSELPVVVTKLLEVADPDLYDKLLILISIMIKNSVKICHKILKERVMDFILMRLMEPQIVTKTRNPFPRNYDISCKILWVLLNSSKQVNADFVREEYCPKDVNLRKLDELLKLLTINKNKVDRNYVMGIVLLFLDLFSNFPLISSGLALDLGILCAATEIGSGGTWLSKISFGTDQYDYEFKKMLILSICYASKIPESLKVFIFLYALSYYLEFSQILHPKRIIPSLLRIITPELTTHWHPQQLEKLMSMALAALEMIVQPLADDFVHANGPLRLLIMIEHYYVDPYEISVFKNCLKTLHYTTSLKIPDIINNLIANTAQSILLNLVFKLLDQPCLNLDNQQCLMYAFSTLECICRAEKSDEKAIEVCTTFLKRVLQRNPTDHLLDPNFLISGLDYLWESIVWNRVCLEKFTSKGGVYLLLDCIEISSYPVKIVGLGALVDMCDVGLCVPHLITWRGKRKKLMSLLLEEFRLENLRMGVKSNCDGIIADVEIPLMGHQQWFETFNKDKDPNSSPATVDLLGSVRPKVYAIINLLTNRHECRVQIANDHYRMFDLNSLSTIDKVTLMLAENFLALKLGEAWVEVGQDIERSGICPLAIDEGFIVQLKRRFLKWSQHIQIAQKKLLEKQLINANIDYNTEMSLYCLLRESKLPESLTALHELDYIARTTEKMFRLMNKIQHCYDIERTEYCIENGSYHTTYMSQLKVTPVFNQIVDIQSDIIKDENESDAASLVSEIELIPLITIQKHRTVCIYRFVFL
ncbi:hypothetical protein FQR65_LT03754 [Abscondita terminalis]|nr:hypothetical protein FQR65_LT03754 [Abscondita terminalis]